MTANISTATSRELGEEPGRLREGTTIHTARSLSAALGWDPSKVSNIEIGRARASELDLMQYLTLCGFNREQIDEFYDRYRAAFEPFQVRLPENLRTLAHAESTATKIVSYDSLTIPGLLQLETYARALFDKLGLCTPEITELGVSARIERQVILRRVYRPDCMFFIHENALRTVVGDAGIMIDQLMRLMVQPAVRIVPDAAYCGAHKLLQYEKHPLVVYSEFDLGQLFAQDSTTTARCNLIFERLDGIALSESESRALLMKYVNMYAHQRRGLA